MSLLEYFLLTLLDTTLGQGRKRHFQTIFSLDYLIPLKDNDKYVTFRVSFTYIALYHLIGQMSFSDYFSLDFLVQPSGKDNNLTFTLLSQLWDNDLSKAKAYCKGVYTPGNSRIYTGCLLSILSSQQSDYLVEQCKSGCLLRCSYSMIRCKQSV